MTSPIPYYTQGDLSDVAAATLSIFAQAQAFLDGNKRTGMASALSFLEGNGVPIQASTDPFHDAMIAVAERCMDKTRFAAMFRKMAHVE